MKTAIRCTAVIFTMILFAGTVRAQEVRYYDAKSLTLIGRAHDTGGYYHRVDTARYPDMPARVKALFTNPSGMAVVFRTDSESIRAKWTLRRYNVLNNMTAIAHSGLDLYIRRNGQWVFAGVARPSGVSNEYTIIEKMAPGEKECLLYLPLYNEMTGLEIGVDTGARLDPSPNPFTRKIVLYGSSITQGASASRPGLNYSSRMSRSTGWYIINLGLSGTGKMEREVADMVAGIDGDVFLLDCAANPSPEEIAERTNYFVKTIRSAHPNAPIVMIQRTERGKGSFGADGKGPSPKNASFTAEYKRLIAEGVKDLYMIKGADFLGHDYEGTVDGTHPNDLGFDRLLRVLEPQLVKILRRY